MRWINQAGDLPPFVNPPWKTSLILNASRTADFSVVRLLVEAGVGVAAHFRCRPAQMNRLVEELWDGGGRIVALPQDVEGRAAYALLMGDAEQALGPIDIVIDLCVQSDRLYDSLAYLIGRSPGQLR